MPVFRYDHNNNRESQGAREVKDMNYLDVLSHLLGDKYFSIPKS